jgi:hypothetical protein
MKAFKKVFYFPLLFLLIASSLHAWEDIYGGRGNFSTDSDFHLLYGGSGNAVFGDFTATGNSILSSNNPTNASLIYDTTTYKTVDTEFNTNAYSLGDAEKMNSSSAQITLPSYVQGSDIVWAGLFWQGHVYRQYGAYTDASVDASAANWNKVTIKDAAGNMHAIEAPIGSNDTTHKAFHHTITSGTGYRHHYGAYHDVTSIIQNSYSSSQNTFTVGNIKTTAGNDNGGYVYITQAPTYSGSFRFGLYGGWSLIVAYDVDGSIALANSVPPKNISIYDGFDLFLTWGYDTVPFETTIDVSGFYTPKSGAVNSKLLLFGGAGDRSISNDTLQIQNQNNVGTYTNLSNTPNQSGEQFNHTYTEFGNHLTPGDENKQGMDLDIFDVSSQMTNAQSETKIKFGVQKVGANLGGNCDQIFPQVIAFSTELYVPKFCYDYAYKQQGKYFTEKNDGTKDPRLVGNVIEDANGDLNTSVDVTIFLRNLVESDIEIRDMNISILDMNTTQVKYKRESTSLAMIPNIIPVDIADSSLTVSDSAIQNIDIGDMSSNDYFYVYYSLNPQQSDLNMSINVKGSYNLLLTGTGEKIPYQLELGANIDMCSSTNFNYAPVKGMFNVVHNNYFPYSDGNNYYNLPTQVTSREGNFKAVVMDPDDLDSVKNIPQKTRVAVELIDVSAFHDTFTSCKELESAITPRIWVEFDANTSTTPFNQATLIAAATKANALEAAGGEVSKLPNSYDFYKVANENTAFRISYNTDGVNDFVLDYTQTSPGMYEINNFPASVRTIGTCSHDVFYFDKNGNFKKDVKQVATACGNAGSSISESQLEACLECIYGYNTELVCSRDNFSLRPEAFLIHLDDQNQTNPTNPLTPQERLTTNFSGVAGATANVVNMSADYNYNIEVIATNHKNNISSPGYTKSFNSSNLNDTSEYTWEPKGLSAAQLAARNLACNDVTNKSSDMRFVDGLVDINTSVNQVGEYRLNIQDTSWTTVDHNSAFMSHHAGAYFLPASTADCVVNSSSTQNVSSSSLNGCNIASSHTNSEANLKYNDYNITFHPYKFNINTTVTMGLNNRDVNTTDDFSNFVYMANINVANDINMSVQLNNAITPQGYNGSSLTNFVTGCYAKPLDINISKSAPFNTALNYRYILSDRNTTGTVSGLITNVGNEDANITTPTTFFAKAMNGVLNSIMNLNFDRNQNIVANPEDINYSKITVYDPRTFINADLLTNKTAESNISLNGSIGQNITHYFGRTAARKTRVVCDGYPCLSGANGEPNVLIYYEAYCYGDTNSNTCDRTLLPQLSGRYIQKVDSRWYVNLNHTESDDGNLTATSEIGNVLVTVPNITIQNNYTKNSVHSYNGNNGLPYEGNMQSIIPNWLIYDENDPFAMTNKHLIIYQTATTWTGKHETNTTTQTEKVRRVNRRTMW